MEQNSPPVTFVEERIYGDSNERPYWGYFIQVSPEQAICFRIYSCYDPLRTPPGFLNVFLEGYNLMASAICTNTGARFLCQPDPARKSSLRSLLARLEAGNKPLLGQNSEEILLDIDVDGARYLVLRMPKATPQRAQLSPREQEIVRMVAQGHPNKIIADCLGIRPAGP